MNFDVFNSIEIPEHDILLSNCKSAERNIMISPYNAIANSRASLEILCKSLIRAYKLNQIVPENGQPNLATMIDTCLRDKMFTNMEAAALIRKNGNDALHANKKAQKLHVVNEDNVNKAIDSVRGLFHILSEVFKEIAIDEFDINKIPFGFYEIVRAVPKAENEIIYGDYNYFVKDPKENYYYFQVFHRNSKIDSNNELGARGVLTGNRIKEDKGRRSYLLDVHYPSNLLAESDRDYVAYSVYSDSMLLSEVGVGVLEEKQIIQIALDLLNVLLELKRIGNGIHLRNIQPGNVIITPNGENYLAGVVNMETAKIEGYEATVYASMKFLMIENPYLPREVRDGTEGNSIQWDKVDIYSIAKIMVYCKNPSLVKAEIDEKDIYSSFSEDVANILVDILGSSINAVDEIEDIKEKLEDALSEL